MFVSLVSGSSGNCALLSDGKTAILADCGLSCKKMEDALSKTSISPADLSGIVITHEHTDHIRGLSAIAKKYNLPVYATAKTHEAIKLNLTENIKYISPDIDFEIGTIGVCPFSIPHDAAGPVGYNFYFGDTKLSLATDIGKMTEDVFNHLKGSIGVLLESNHDVNMLKLGRYPMVLKRRILGDLGHLSNDAAAETALELAKNGTRHIMLGHLSNENNTPNIAYTNTADYLIKNGAELGKDIALSVAARYEVSCFR